MHRVPQVLVNVRVKGRVDVSGSSALGAAVREVERELGDGGRVLVRGSGTEPLVRIMIEADEQAVADSAAGHLRAVVSAEFGADGTP